jgi:hypothetical protein
MPLGSRLCGEIGFFLLCTCEVVESWGRIGTGRDASPN